MNKTQRILALIGAILLVAMYIVALIMTILDNTSDMRYFKAAVVMTIIVPVLIWAYSFVYKLVKKDDVNNSLNKNISDKHDIKNDLNNVNNK